jgi:hypothetical protein
MTTPPPRQGRPTLVGFRVILNEEPFPLTPYADAVSYTPTHARRMREHGEPTPYVRSKQRPAVTVQRPPTRAPLPHEPASLGHAIEMVLAAFVVCALTAAVLSIFR